MEFVTITTAKQMRNKINTKGTIKSISPSRDVNLKAGGTTKVTDAILSDDDGEIKLSLWGDDGNDISVGSKVEIQNGYINEWNGQVSLGKGKFGAMLISQ